MTRRIKISVIHGPNLNLLGKREPGIYGATTLAKINARLKKLAREKDAGLDIFQSNHEGALIDRIQKSCRHDGLIINPAAYTHTSIAIRDALLAVGKPFVEVHLSDIKKREKFRRRSYLSDIAYRVIAGRGAAGYTLALSALIRFLKGKK